VIAAEDPPPLEADPRLAAVVLRCLEKSADDRYQDVAALAADLKPFGGPRARKIVRCWCQSHDAVHAHAALRLLASQRDRETVRRACKKDRVEL
jgi:hypothetical protein